MFELQEHHQQIGWWKGTEGKSPLIRLW